MINLRELATPVINVKDYQFLHGYHNPTILFLCEHFPTWAGLVCECVYVCVCFCASMYIRCMAYVCTCKCMSCIEVYIMQQCLVKILCKCSMANSVHSASTCSSDYFRVYYHLRRLPVRKDTCGIVAVSINISSQQYPVIWTMANLPFDCFKAMAVPKPLGELVCVRVCMCVCGCCNF